MPAARSRPSRSPIRCLSGRIGLTRSALLVPERPPSGQVRQTLDALSRRSELRSSWYAPARLRLAQPPEPLRWPPAAGQDRLALNRLEIAGQGPEWPPSAPT